MGASPDTNPARAAPAADIFPADTVLLADRPASQQNASTSACTGEFIVTKDGITVDAGLSCVGDAKYWLSFSLVWTDRTHPGTPPSHFWFPMVSQAHAAGYVCTQRQQRLYLPCCSPKWQALAFYSNSNCVLVECVQNSLLQVPLR